MREIETLHLVNPQDVGSYIQLNDTGPKGHGLASPPTKQRLEKIIGFGEKGLRLHRYQAEQLVWILPFRRFEQRARIFTPQEFRLLPDN